MTAKVALFLLGERKYALPVEGILQILPMERVFRLPWLRPGVSGIFLTHGEVAPLLDLPALFGKEVHTSKVLSAFLVIYGSESGSVGLPADKVLQMVSRDQGKVQEAGVDQRRNGVDAFFVYNGEGYPLLFVDALLAALSS